ncbi:MAG: LysR family transcriptional regulator [Alphaproteobacteria bacterium]|nr:LysR family transcriptional regulator [Alphaproteobacteria bacterium]
MPFRLPPLPALRLFEAAGRLGSFKAAAAELNVTPSAVSHAIVGLEQALGTELFVRGPRGLSLTAAGADYLTYVSEALSLIAIGTQRLPNRRSTRSIAVSCAPTFASRWLMPRLPAFIERWPKVTVTVDTSRGQVGFPVDQFDFAIRMSRAPVAGLAWVKLLGEQLVPVCSRSYRSRLIDGQGNVDLRRARLIHVTSASEGWQAWLEARAIDDVDVKAGIRLDTLELAFAAATLGLGVALGRRPMVDRDLQDGSLVELYSEPLVAETAYWLVSSENADRRPDLRDFKRWLIAEAQAIGDERAE